MKIIVGLGNPGKEYFNTRHNVGFMVLDNYAQSKNIVFNKKQFDGLYAEFMYDGQKIILLKPQKYMNLSGEVVSAFTSYYKISVDDILIICDDLDMDIGRFKLKQNSSSGGHNGLKNIEKCLNTNSYKRLKIGISNDKNLDTKDYVLGKFSISDQEQLKNIIDKSVFILDEFLSIDFNMLMNKFN